MRFLPLLAAFIGLTAAVPLAENVPRDNNNTQVESSGAKTCRKPIVRKEWRTLSIPERKRYLAAVLCLTKKPSKAPSGAAPGARHRYDDFNTVHIIMSDGFLTGSGGVHMVGFFLHWHRYFVATYEQALRDECGYTGAQPYWNWSLDAASGLPMEQWPIYNPDYGFGGNGPYTTDHNATVSWPYQAGQTGGGCVSDGPFVNMTVNVGPGLQIGYNPHCLHRGLNPDTIPALKKENTDAALLKGSFVEFDTAVQGAQDMKPEDGITIFHGAGHYAQGGDSTDFISSTSEPIFWLHHAYIDYLYWQWQQKNPEVRLSEVGGVRLPFNPSGGNVTLDQPLNLKWEADTIPLSRVMDIQGLGKDGGVLCYDYE